MPDVIIKTGKGYGNPLLYLFIFLIKVLIILQGQVLSVDLFISNKLLSYLQNSSNICLSKLL